MPDARRQVFWPAALRTSTDGRRPGWNEPGAKTPKGGAMPTTLQPVAARPALPATKYVELFKDKRLKAPTQPVGPGYDVLFDEKLKVDGWKEIRVWVHVFVENYASTPVTNAAHLQLRFMHDFGAGARDSFDYESADIGFNGFTSYIDGYAVKPIIGKELRLLCHPTDLPPGPYLLSVTYMLDR
jgi:hypothetical protein